MGSAVPAATIDDHLDGCELCFADDVIDDADAELFPLFAEALDPQSPKTIEEAEAEWRELFR